MPKTNQDLVPDKSKSEHSSISDLVSKSTLMIGGVTVGNTQTTSPSVTGSLASFSKISFISRTNEMLNLKSSILDFGRFLDIKIGNIQFGDLTEPDPDYISRVSITSEGVLSEDWHKIDNVQSQIIDFTDQYVTLECLNYETKEFEIRQFDREIIEGAVDLKLRQLVMIRIYRRPGEIRFKFIDGTNLVGAEYFESKELARLYETLKESSTRLTKEKKFN